MTPMPAVRLADVSKSFARVKAVDHVSLQINNGEYVCILGPTGSGKTTLLRLIAGLTSPTDGNVEFDNRVVTGIRAEDRNAVYVPQQYALFPHMTVRENVAFGPLARGFSREESLRLADEMLSLVRLAHRAGSLPHELSGGMQQRVALARGLAGRSPLLLLDEPLGALDARLRVMLRYELRKLAKELAVTVVHVTHDQQEAMSIADRIAVLREGRIEQFGRPSKIYTAPDSPFLANFVGGANFLEGTVVQKGPERMLVEVAEGFSLAARTSDYQVGEAVVASFRQERTSVLTSANLEENVVPGRLVSTSLLGVFLRCSIDLGRPATVVAKVPLREALDQRLPDLIGELVYVHAGPDSVCVFKRPRRALAVELEAI